MRIKRAVANAQIQRAQRGQSLTELALLLPVLVLVLMGTVDLARVYLAYVTITNAAREGARAGANDPTNTSAITTRVQQEATNSGINPGSLSVGVACFKYSDGSSLACDSTFAGDKLKVTVTYPFQFVTTYIFGLGTITLSNFEEMVISK